MKNARRRLEALEASMHGPPVQPIDPPLDLDALTSAEREEIERLGGLVRWHGGQPDFKALDDEEFARFDVLIQQARRGEAVPRGGGNGD